MQNQDRIRALDVLNEYSVNPFFPFNPLFKSNINVLEEVFNKGGVKTNHNFYVPRDGNYEQEFCKEKICPVRSSGSHKGLVLRGKVGRGKTTFIRYCLDVVIPRLFDNVFSVYLDAQSYREDAEQYFENNFKDTFRIEIENRFFNGNSFEFETAFVRSLGYTTANQADINQIFTNSFEISKLLKFVDNYEFKNKDKNGGILIVIDNIDENPTEVVMQGDTFAKQLLKIADEVCKNKSLTTFVNVRNYNNKYFATASYVSHDLEKVDLLKVVISKLKELSKKIEESAKTFRQEISYTFTHHHSTVPQKRTFIVSKGGMVKFLKSLIEFLRDNENKEVLDLVEKISSGNLKFVVENMFNFLQSTKLPLSELFRKTFTPPNAISYKDIAQPLTFDIFLECLLSVHYSYYCVEESKIMNLFNCLNTSSINDYHCVLIIPRILFYLLDKPARTYNGIKKFFVDRGYEEKYVEEAIKRCFEYGVFDTTHGTKRSHINDDKTKLSLSEAGECYAKRLIGEVSYLQYVCEDTFVTKEFYVPIENKYPIGDSQNLDNTKNKTNRLKSANYLIEFVAFCEAQELSQVEREGFTIQDYLDKASPFDPDYNRGRTLSTYLKLKTNKSLQNLNLNK